MPIADFTNWTPEHCKRVIHKYQETRDEKLFDLLLLKYDKYLVKLAWRYRNRLNVSLEDVYHTAILGFGNAMAQFKPDAPAFIIMKVICAYVKREIEAKYITIKTEEPVGLLENAPVVTRPSDDALEAHFIFNAPYLSVKERELLSLRFEKGMSFFEMGEVIGVSRRAVSRRLAKVIAKVKNEIGN